MDSRIPESSPMQRNTHPHSLDHFGRQLSPSLSSETGEPTRWTTQTTTWLCAKSLWTSRKERILSWSSRPWHIWTLFIEPREDSECQWQHTMSAENMQCSRPRPGKDGLKRNQQSWKC